jgi:hypothetical protein
VPKGVTDQQASRLFQGFYEDGLKALAAGFPSQGKVAGGDCFLRSEQLASLNTI